MSDFLVGIDAGTTGCKSVVFDLDGNVLGQYYREYPCLYPGPGLVEQRYEDIIPPLTDSCREAVAASGVSPEEIRAVVFSSQAPLLALVDAGGNLIRDFLSLAGSAGRAIHSEAAGGLRCRTFLPRDRGPARDKQRRPVTSPGKVVGRIGKDIARRAGLAESTLLCLGAHDQNCSTFGGGAVRGGDCVMVMGTFGSCYVVMDEPLRDPARKLVVKPNHGMGNWTIEAFSNTSASSLRWYRDTFCHEECAAGEVAGVAYGQAFKRFVDLYESLETGVF